MDILSQKQTTELETKLGKITVETPSVSKKLEIERRRSVYAGGLTVMSQQGAELANMFATLDIVMTKSPLTRDKNADAWNYDEIYDEDVIKDAYDKAVEWLNSFRKGVSSKQA
ncbi:hypothetical protein LSG31_00370 [Fodinisporobacter ferrooxydans]|uniref:Uncharacterized protein n=1 Tax=Fodinisporobacter ferrooxydans TaxID=2901836 RepID=A0ABY4CMV6_9BACL|nr:hypothetical protein LSG31_00370 [Alicyclobacillaceae bacterium MYW30-H2]